ncbi:MAG: cob(I)yrinic acid a,c-diamide adenosyltransferase [Lachnospiraceae bacterium]|uniref:cob(I)yrinic acid a,c-diamide adenosyltransferase n=1 Tax=Roseburia sp. 1XD42-69 TaxID=2320088 RepID=UPI000EA23625|nr:cob(I)yrinic acid a,c-diamide adenosyltransferase [Roseburia sp. 1XD42-69]MCI8875698.1 cob(I)yrinic acid a,c-diamide adenosyltransferase [Lachnospiraceae bacterium]RKJ67853.1 cob(I)yrinic acid a c-diamide adenosyltransferase [Roseburia sp. 1XD42-69]
MATGRVEIYYGEGRGKSSSALGTAIQAVSEGKDVFIIQFLKGKSNQKMEFLKRLEPEIKFFRFEKSQEYFNELSGEQQEEEAVNIKNGMNFARKVLSTGECDLLVLDEVLGLIDNRLIELEELKNMILARPEGMEVVLTGRVFQEELRPLADQVYHIVTEP